MIVPELLVPPPVRVSRALEAADDERRRIARDLHDGLQGHLVLLAIQAGELQREPTLTSEGRAGLDALAAGLQTAITELRRPRPRRDAGDADRARALRGGRGARGPLPDPRRVDVEHGRGALPGAVETAGYFLLAEALANAVKHSHAAGVRLRIARDDRWLRIELRDDGIGGAHPGDGAGLRGMADRAEALGGRLAVTSPPGGGTTILAELPCAS